MARKTQQLPGQHQPLVNVRVVRVKPGAQQVVGHGALPIKPEMLFGKALNQHVGYAQRFTHIADGALGPVGDDGGGNCGPLAPVFLVDVLDDFFAPVVLKIHVNVRRLVALP